MFIEYRVWLIAICIVKTQTRYNPYQYRQSIEFKLAESRISIIS